MVALPVDSREASLRELRLLRSAIESHRAATKGLAETRNAAIRRALAAGLSLTEVGGELGVTRQAVARHAHGGIV